MLVASNNDRADDPAERREGGGRKRVLSWRDSYLLYRMHQWVAGATTTRLAFDFGVSVGTAVEYVRCWAAVEHIRLQAFGTPTVFEHLGLRSTDDPWTTRFARMVVIMHDTSEWRLLGCPSDHALARLVANIYYHSYCLKVIACLPSSVSLTFVKVMVSTTPWSFVMAPPAPVWTGGITDTLHLGANGILERQAAQLADYRRCPKADTSVNVHLPYFVSPSFLA